jgi:hypothetical protein
MRRTASSIVLVLALGTGSVSAQSSVESRLANRLDAHTRSSVVAIIDSARAASLPVEPLIDKALEGAAKRGSAQSIISAVRTFYVQLGEAKRALGTGSTELELLGGAQAIRAGIPVQQIERLRRARSGVQIATALTVASDLVSRLVPVDTAVSVVASLVGASATDDQLLAVRGDIEADIVGGLPPAVAASTRGDALEKTLAASAPPNGAGTPGVIPSPLGTSRTGDAGTNLKPPSTAVGSRQKPPAVQRKRP